VKYNGLEFDPSKVKESITVKPQLNQQGVKAFKEHDGHYMDEPHRDDEPHKDGDPSGKNLRYLLPRIEAIHAGATRNHTRYPAEKLRGSQELKSGVYSWLHPYAKPVIHNHDIETEATGRIQTASFSEYTQAGRPGIIVVPKITEEKAINDILGGRLLTVSIGATTDAAICSVCGTDIISEGFCGHMKGEEYDGIVAEWIIGNVWFDELSWVNVPADQDAQIISGGETIHAAEAFAANGREIVNLGKTTTEWLVNPETALAEGLTTERGKGDSTLTEEEIKALKDEFEVAKTAKETAETELTSVKEAKEVVDGELVTAQKSLTDKETELEESKTKLTSTQEELDAKKTEVEELTTAKESLEAEKATLETTLDEEKQANEQTTEENTRLASEMHKMTAERVVDLRISLGKEVDRDKAIEQYVGRSSESLSDSLSDLVKESVVAPPVTNRNVDPITNPAANSINDSTETNSIEDMSEEDVLVSLFGGNKKK
jgi:predicted  nucleic acid-binding Zn-ribbon protein